MDKILLETGRIIIRKLILEDIELLYEYSQEEITKRELPDEVYKQSKKHLKNVLKNGKKIFQILLLQLLSHLLMK